MSRDLNEIKDFIEVELLEGKRRRKRPKARRRSVSGSRKQTATLSGPKKRSTTRRRLSAKRTSKSSRRRSTSGRKGNIMAMATQALMIGAGICAGVITVNQIKAKAPDKDITLLWMLTGAAAILATTQIKMKDKIKKYLMPLALGMSGAAIAVLAYTNLIEKGMPLTLAGDSQSYWLQRRNPRRSASTALAVSGGYLPDTRGPLF